MQVLPFRIVLEQHAEHGDAPHALGLVWARRERSRGARTVWRAAARYGFMLITFNAEQDLKAMRPKPTIDGEAVPQTGPTDAEREANRQRINNDRSFEHRLMTQPIGRNAPQPSGPRMPQPDAGGFHWGGSKGRAW